MFRESTKLGIIFTAIGLALCFVSTASAQHKASVDAATGKLWQPVNVAVGDSPARGPADAKVTIIEFADYTCPFCIELEPTMRKIADEGNVRFVVKHHWLLAHKHARLAAQVAIAAGLQGKFWEVHDMLFDKHFAAGPAGATIDGYLPYLKTIPGLDIAQLQRDVNSPEVNAILDRELADVKSTATPEIVINGHIFTGQISENQFHTLIKEASQPSWNAR